MRASAERIEKGLWWDKAWSLVSGCTPVSEACRHCWAARETHMRAEHPNAKVRERAEGLVHTICMNRSLRLGFNGQVRFNRELLDIPRKARKPAIWAIWTDLFHEAVNTDDIKTVYEIMEECRDQTFVVCTKRPERIVPVLYGEEGGFFLGLGDYLPNIWHMTTTENQKMAEKRIPPLLRLRQVSDGWPVLAVSVEPMLGPVSLAPWIDRLDWVICGEESGLNRKRRITDPDWIRNIRDQCRTEEKPFFLKQMDVGGKLIKMPRLDGRAWCLFPEDRE